VVVRAERASIAGADWMRGERSNASLADRHNPLSFGLFGLTCRLCVRRIAACRAGDLRSDSATC
jgi:hypothetical protein